MLLVELWIDYRPLENLLCMKSHRLSITQGGKKKKKKRHLCCHFLELEEEEHEGKEQILFA